MFVLNFKILGQVVSEKSLTECFQKYTYLSSLCIQNLKTLALIEAELIKWKNIGKKEKRTNKGTDKQYEADYLIHDTTYHTRCLYKISKS